MKRSTMALLHFCPVAATVVLAVGCGNRVPTVASDSATATASPSAIADARGSDSTTNAQNEETLVRSGKDAHKPHKVVVMVRVQETYRVTVKEMRAELVEEKQPDGSVVKKTVTKEVPVTVVKTRTVGKTQELISDRLPTWVAGTRNNMPGFELTIYVDNESELHWVDQIVSVTPLDVDNPASE